ncbi:hypothetical protein B0A49_12837 [Cryomyces minteri]|uniref:Uncharacterized protein n=1 Tax=Cryomyces minteri TaxID=331657 RepID=A0A4U0W790_9PEZI|nr:hypothetical protein B0A49_12837 [Cryomyces minteri]
MPVTNSHPPGFNNPPRRIPKIAVRNRFVDDTDEDAPRSFSNDGTADRDRSKNSIRDAELPPLMPTRTPERPSSSARDSFSRSSSTSHASPETPARDYKKRKNSSLFGFLTLKEPSQLALEDFAEQQRKIAAAKGGRVTAVGLPGVSTQKLPPTVPKVNTKWDGLPNSAREREKERERELRSTKRGSSATFSSQHKGSSDSSFHGSIRSQLSQGAPNSLASMSVYPIDEAKPKPYTASQKSRHSAKSSQSSPSISSNLPPGRVRPNPDDHPALRSPGLAKTATSLSDRSGTSYFFSSDADEAPSSLSEHDTSSSAAVTPLELSPLTPVDASFLTLDSKRLPLHDFATPRAYELNEADDEATRCSSRTDPEDIVIRSSGPDVLDPPATAEKAPRSTQMGFLAGEAQELRLSDEESDSTKSTIKHASRRPAIHVSPGSDTSTASIVTLTSSNGSSHPASASMLSTSTRPSTAQSVISFSPVRNTVHIGADSGFDTASIAESHAPSEMSAQWYRSPRERLGLGGRINRKDALPWESASAADSSSSRRDRNSTPAPGAADKKTKQHRRSLFGKR